MYTAKRRTSCRWFAETDSRNQPLQQELRWLTEMYLPPPATTCWRGGAGHRQRGLSDALRYALRDSLGFADVLVFSTNPDSAPLYQYRILEVGYGGDYVEDGFTASGRIFHGLRRWKSPGSWCRRATTLPCARPEQLQVVTGGGTLQLGKGGRSGNGAACTTATPSQKSATKTTTAKPRAGTNIRAATDSLPCKWDLEVAGEYVAETFSPRNASAP